MITETPTVDQLLELAHKLPREQRGQLIARLVLELTTETPPTRPPMTPDEARAAVGALPQPRLTTGEQLDADRRERQALIEGSTG